MSFDGLLSFYHRISRNNDGIIDFDCINNKSIKNVTKNAFDKYDEYMKTNHLTEYNIIIGSNVRTRDCEFYRRKYDLKLNTFEIFKHDTILFDNIINKENIMHLKCDFLFLRLDSSYDHIIKPYKNFINIIQPKFVLLNYEQNKVPINLCDPEIIYSNNTLIVDGYKNIDKGACKTGQYYDILTKYMNYDKKKDYECYYVEYVLLFEKI